MTNFAKIQDEIRKQEARVKEAERQHVEDRLALWSVKYAQGKLAGMRAIANMASQANA